MKQCPTCNKQFKNLQEHITKSHSEKHDYVIKYRIGQDKWGYKKIAADIYQDGILTSTEQHCCSGGTSREPELKYYYVKIPNVRLKNGDYCLVVKLHNDTGNVVASYVGLWGATPEATRVSNSPYGTFKIIDPVSTTE